MKTRITFLLAFLLASVFSTTASAQEKEVDGFGEGLDLRAVLGVFKQSKNLEDFEKRLNDEATGVNNLDLNGDGRIDYIRVVDRADAQAHAITLEVPISGSESQDVAVIAIEKQGNESAQLQVIGDEVLYGENYIIEPSEAMQQGGKGASYHGGLFFNVWYWSCVNWIFMPNYYCYVSPWYWDYYPTYWYPWYPCSWDLYYPRVRHHHYGCSRSTYVTVVHAHTIYRTNRVRSNTVYQASTNGHRGGNGSGHATGQPSTSHRDGSKGDRPQSTSPASRPQEREVKPNYESRPSEPRPQREERPQTRPQEREQPRPTESPRTRPSEPRKEQPSQKPKESPRYSPSKEGQVRPSHQGGGSSKPRPSAPSPSKGGGGGRSPKR